MTSSMKSFCSVITFFLIVLLWVVPALAQTSPRIFDALPGCDFSLDSPSDVRIGAVLLNFETGQGCAQNLDMVFQTASVPKLFVAGAYYDWLLQGVISGSTPLLFDQNYWMGGRNDCLGESRLGEQLRTQELVELMISCSDNAATWMVMDSLGWGRIQSYVADLRLGDVGPVLPYSEVDRLKLIHLDSTWESVPRAIASRYYRRRLTDGLVPRFFSEAPELNASRFIEANTWYMQNSVNNTLTPRALATYLLNLREDFAAMSTTNALVARRLFSAMQLTQRLQSTQAFPGDMVIGAKNGFDWGVMAEVSLIYERDDINTPAALLLIFTQQDNLSAFDAQRPSLRDGTLNDFLRESSDEFFNILFPDYVAASPGTDGALSLAFTQSEENLSVCWGPYRQSDRSPTAVPFLQSCWAQLGTQGRFSVGDNLGLGLVMQQLGGQDVRLALVYTAPNGQRYSYEVFERSQQALGVFWLHPLDQRGIWQLEVFHNQVLVYRSSIEAS